MPSYRIVAVNGRVRLERIRTLVEAIAQRNDGEQIQRYDSRRWRHVSATVRITTHNVGCFGTFARLVAVGSNEVVAETELYGFGFEFPAAAKAQEIAERLGLGVSL